MRDTHVYIHISENVYVYLSKLYSIFSNHVYIHFVRLSLKVIKA